MDLLEAFNKAFDQILVCSGFPNEDMESNDREEE
jgi:hypothetical protein